MAETSIEWTDATWNPVAGCTVLTAGCTNCYAMRMAARLEAMGMAKYAALTRKSGKRALVDRCAVARRDGADGSARLVEAAHGLRQLDVRSVP